MRGAHRGAIRELAGYQNLSTTRRYMHISAGAIEDAMWLLETPRVAPLRGDIVETADDSALEVVVDAGDRRTWRREQDPP